MLTKVLNKIYCLFSEARDERMVRDRMVDVAVSIIPTFCGQHFDMPVATFAATVNANVTDAGLGGFNAQTLETILRQNVRCHISGTAWQINRNLACLHQILFHETIAIRHFFLFRC